VQFFKEICAIKKVRSGQAFHLGACDMTRDGETNSLPGSNVALRPKKFSLQKSSSVNPSREIFRNGPLITFPFQ
jgi:hypothetical protein